MNLAPAADETLVYLVRHGEVENPHGVLYGRLPDFHLSARGLAMADRLGEYFADTEFDHLVCSPLTRAQETIAPIARGRGLDVLLDPRVIEAGNRFEGQVFGYRNKALRDPRNWWLLRNPLKPSWGEPFKSVAARMREAILAAADTAGPGDRALIVSHQLPIWVARLDAEGRRLAHDPRRRQCTVASVTIFRIRDARVVGIQYVEPCADLVRVGVKGDTISTGGEPGPEPSAPGGIR